MAPVSFYCRTGHAARSAITCKRHQSVGQNGAPQPGLQPGQLLPSIQIQLASVPFISKQSVPPAAPTFQKLSLHTTGSAVSCPGLLPRKARELSTAPWPWELPMGSGIKWATDSTLETEQSPPGDSWKAYKNN